MTYFFIWLFSCIFSTWLGRSIKKGWLGFILAFLFGPFGLVAISLIVLYQKNKKRINNKNLQPVNIKKPESSAAPITRIKTVRPQSITTLATEKKAPPIEPEKIQTKTPQTKVKEPALKRPEDYKDIILRWEINGKEYGPMQLSTVLQNKWSNQPLESRFEDSGNWQPFSCFKNLANNLGAPQDILDFLKKHSIQVNTSKLKYMDAYDLYSRERDKIKKINATKKTEKDGLPATKQSIKIMEGYGLSYHENITRGEANKLIKDHRKKLKKQEDLKTALKDFKKCGIDIKTAFGINDPDNITETETDNLLDRHDVKEEIDELIKKLRKIDINLLKQFSLADIIEKAATEEYFTYNLEYLYDSFKQLSKFEIDHPFPETLNADSLDKANDKIECAFDEAESAEDQIKDREIYTDTTEFKIKGPLPKSSYKSLRKEVIELALSDQWNMDDDLISLVEKHFPEAELKDLYED